MTAITVAIVDDHEIVREGVALYLGRARPEVDVVGSAPIVADLPEDVIPDIVILDLVLRDRQSLEDVPALVSRAAASCSTPARSVRCRCAMP